MLEFNFSPFPVLESHRLLLRRLTADDVEQVYRLRSDPETMKYIPRPLVTDHQGAMDHINLINEKIDTNEAINWAITLKGDSGFIGIIGFYRTRKENFRSEIGYMILPEYSGKGITSEAVNRVLQYGFEVLNFHSAEAVIAPENEASERVLQKNGFVKEGHFIENEYYNGKFLDTVIYSLLKRNYKNTAFPM
ncbi:GNAT family N-acetyltransferase [Flavobacterium pallidum]|uniref:N-acetyltransferase n=1 Tax=Flavobacterium pallidum TaxID=2172098 RepID=A0A2S1SLK1_9FLAO|nr:GNAT family N-acetyltransferase [Flavobacterium pallidum]AWI27236.1 N-acetyltransferase [Flavobacterium pallidum]